MERMIHMGTFDCADGYNGKRVAKTLLWIDGAVFAVWRGGYYGAGIKGTPEECLSQIMAERHYSIKAPATMQIG